MEMEERERKLRASLSMGHDEALLEFARYLEYVVDNVAQKEDDGQVARIKQVLYIEKKVYELANRVFEKIREKGPEDETKGEAEELMKEVQALFKLWRQ